MDIEDDKKCNYDFLEVRESKDGPLLTDRICGDGPVDDIVSNANEIFIRFESDDATEHKGFKIHFNPGKFGFMICINSTIMN